MSVAGTWVLGKVTDQVILPGFDEGVSQRTALLGGAAILAVAVLRSLGVVFRRYFGVNLVRSMQRTWFVQVTDTYLRVPLSYFGRHPTGRLMAHADADIERAVNAIMPLPFSLGVIVLIALSVVALAAIDPLLMLVGLALFPALGALNRYYSRRVEDPAARTQAHLGEVATVAHESFDGALVVKTLGLEEREVGRMAAAAGALRTARLQVARLRASFEPGLEALPTQGTIVLLALGSWRVSTGTITTGQLVQAMALFGILTFPMRVVGYLLEEIPRAVVAADRIDEVLASAGRPEPPPTTARRLPDGPLTVEVTNLRFAYDGDPVLDGVDLHLAPGEVVALVGATGGGKSTLCHLLAHLYRPIGRRAPRGGRPRGRGPGLDPGAGGARLPGDVPVRRLGARELTLGEPIEDTDLRWALDRARAARFVDRLPTGSTRWWASAASRSRAASASGWPWPGPCCGGPGCSSSTTPPPPSTPVEQQILDGLRSSRRHHAHRRPPMSTISWPIGSCTSTAAGWRRRGRTTTDRAVPAYAVAAAGLRDGGS